MSRPAVLLRRIVVAGTALGAVTLVLLGSVGLWAVDSPAISALEERLGQGAPRHPGDVRSASVESALTGEEGSLARSLASEVVEGDAAAVTDPRAKVPRDRVRTFDGGGSTRALWCVRALSDPSGAERGLEVLWVDVSDTSAALCRSMGAGLGVWLVFSVAAWVACKRLCAAMERDAEKQRAFFSVAAHDVKGPLMAADAAVDGAEMGTLSLRDAAERVHRSTDRVRRRTNRLLQVAWAEGGAVESEPCEMDVREAVFDAAAGRDLPEGSVDLPVALRVLADPELVAVAVDAVFSAASQDVVVTGLFRYRGSRRLEAGVEIDDSALAALETAPAVALRLARELMALQEGSLDHEGTVVRLWWPAPLP